MRVRILVEQMGCVPVQPTRRVHPQREVGELVFDGLVAAHHDTTLFAHRDIVDGHVEASCRATHRVGGQQRQRDARRASRLDSVPPGSGCRAAPLRSNLRQGAGPVDAGQALDRHRGIELDQRQLAVDVDDQQIRSGDVEAGAL